MDIEKIPEMKGHEQFFYDKRSLVILTNIVKNFKNPCLLCTPSLGLELEKQGKICRILDIDWRFSRLKGFKEYDMNKPASINEDYDIIICDPPFTCVAMENIFKSINMLKNKDTIIVVSWYQARLDLFLKTLSPLEIKPTGLRVTYRDRKIPFVYEPLNEELGEVVVQLYSNRPGKIKELWKDAESNL